MTRPIRQSVMCTHTVHTVQKDYAVFARMSQNVLWEINWSLIKKMSGSWCTYWQQVGMLYFTQKYKELHIYNRWRMSCIRYWELGINESSTNVIYKYPPSFLTLPGFYQLVCYMEEYMERPRGVKMINTADGHRLCTSHRRKGLYG